MTLKIFVNLTMTLKIFINLIATLKMFINFIGNIFYRENETSSPQFSFGFTYIEFSTIRANNCLYKILSFA
jgi:hypothetical protein